jgi:hypothetical protein
LTAGDAAEQLSRGGRREPFRRPAGRPARSFQFTREAAATR